jgi:hypothetical protein
MAMQNIGLNSALNKFHTGLALAGVAPVCLFVCLRHSRRKFVN